MRALVLDRPGPAASRPLRLDERPDPEPDAADLLLDVAACGVCRTDLQIVEGDLESRRSPIVLGHQVVGRVAAIGRDVDGWAVGDRAGVGWLGSTDGTCDLCRSDRENLCREAKFTGWDRDGGYADRMTVRADFAYRLPDGFADLAAAPLLCGGVIGYRSLRVAGVRPGGTLGLFGFGASALLAIQVAVHWGCRVFVATRSDRERARAIALGAEWAGGYDERVPVPLQAAVTFAPAGEVVLAALRGVDRGATVAINAIHLDRVPEFPYDWLWGERSLRSVANFTRRDAHEFLELAATIPVRTETEVHPLADGGIALERLAAGRVEGAAVLSMA